MLETVHGLLTFPEFKVVYKQHGEELETYTNDKQWWEAFARKWSHTEIIRFEDASFTEEQHQRLKEVEHIDEAFSHFAEEYALNGLFPDQLPEDERVVNHPLKELQLQKENEMIGQNQTSSDIKNIVLEMDVANLGQQFTDMELRLLMKEMEG